MIITGSDYGEILFGRVIKIKKGTGQAEDRLTIVTLENFGDSDKSVPFLKILFWNSKKENGAQLSNRARGLKAGAVISVRGVQDQGDSRKYTGFELKFQGLYKLVQNSKCLSYVLTGKVAKIRYGRGCTSLFVPVNLPQHETIWYRVSLFGELSVCDIKKGDMIIIKSHNMLEKKIGKLTYRDLTGTMVCALHA